MSGVAPPCTYRLSMNFRVLSLWATAAYPWLFAAEPRPASSARLKNWWGEDGAASRALLRRNGETEKRRFSLVGEGWGGRWGELVAALSP